MTQKINDFEKKYNVHLVSKNKSWLMRFVGLFSKKFMTKFWTTFRIPFCKPTISYPSNITDPMNLKYEPTREHELIHVEYIKSSYGLFKAFCLYFLFPLPILFSGRWFIEFPAYLHNIKNHGYDIEKVVNTLWTNYLWCWPKSLMRKKFYKYIK